MGYLEYKSLMEERVLQVFLASQPQLSREAVYGELLRIADAPPDDEVAAAGRSYARFLLSMFEYESFIVMMKEHVRRQRQGVGFCFGVKSRPNVTDGEEQLHV